MEVGESSSMIVVKSGRDYQPAGVVADDEKSGRRGSTVRSDVGRSLTSTHSKDDKVVKDKDRMGDGQAAQSEQVNVHQGVPSIRTGVYRQVGSPPELYLACLI